MKAFESLLCALGLVAALEAFYRLGPSVFLPLLLASTVALLILHSWKTRARWQIAPLWLSIGLSLLVTTNAHLSASLLILGLSISMVLLAALLTLGMPLVALPEPTGPHAVGTTTLTLTDFERASYVTSREMGRQIHVRIFYPADKKTCDESTREALWPEMWQAKENPRFLRFLTSYLRSIVTHCHRDPPISVTKAKLLIYNHGLVSVASDNTLLMEHLASHGFVVAGIQHLAQLQEFKAGQGKGSKAKQESDRSLNKRLASDLEREERARLSLELFESASATNNIVSGRASDTSFVLDRVPELVSHIPGADQLVLDDQRVGALGLSLGGAVATEASKTDERIAAVANLDGGLFGTRLDEPITVPYLMLYSERSAGSNDLLLDPHRRGEGNAHEIVIPDSNHLDFHDVALIAPLLRWLGALGRVDKVQMLRIKQAEIRRHFETSLTAGRASRDRATRSSGRPAVDSLLPLS